MASWLRLFGALAVRSLRNPRVAVALLRIGWRFRTRDWYKRPPFLPLPNRPYLRWRMVTAYGDADRLPSAEDAVRFALWATRRR